jgi:hypothetical protein
MARARDEQQPHPYITRNHGYIHTPAILMWNVENA